MSVQIYSNRHYKVYATEKGFIVHNVRKPFSCGHTHIDKFSTAKYITKLAYGRIVPKHLSRYLLVSLIRISDDKEYKDKLRKVLEKENPNEEPIAEV